MSQKLRAVLLGGYSGDGWISIARYQRELIRCFELLRDPVRIEVTQVAPQPGGFVRKLSSFGSLGKRASSYLSRFVIYPRQIPRIPNAIYHLVDQSLSYLVRYLDPARTVVTCHDLLHFPLKERFERQSAFPWMEDRLYRFCVRGLPRCAAIIAVSQCNKEDAIRYLGCDPSRIRVIHEGVSPAFLQSPDPKRLHQLRGDLGLDSGYVLLHVGIPTLYKNMEGILRALAKLRQTLKKPVTLLRAGSPMTPSQRRLARQLRVLECVRESGMLGDEMLALLNHLADCLVFPSFYEGFGLPPIEAMACGVPVVTSNRGSLPEIVGDAALLVNPEDPSEIAQAVQRILEDPRVREDLRARGLARSARFRWERCALETVQVYQRVLKDAAGNREEAVGRLER